MPDVNEENDQADQAKGSLKKADNPTPPHDVDNIKKKPAIGKSQHLYVVDWQMSGEWKPPVTKIASK